MAINLVTKYADKIAEKFTKESYIAGNFSNEFAFTGARSIRILTPTTVPVGTYDRTATSGSRFGTLTEMQDTVQEMTMSQEPSFNIAIDKGNLVDQNNLKPYTRMLGAQLREQVVPFIDKYAFKKWIQEAGIVTKLDSAPTKSTIVEKIFDASKDIDNALVPAEDRILYIPTTYYNMLRLSTEYLAVDNLAIKALSKGYVGEVADMKVIKVPDQYFPTGLYFLITYKKAVMLPKKISTARVITDSENVDGGILQGRTYFDAFIIGTRAKGVYAAVSSALFVALPVGSITSHSATVTSVTGVTFYYTLDGTDPRYNMSRSTYSAAVTTTAGQTIKVAGKNTSGYWSGVTAVKDE